MEKRQSHPAPRWTASPPPEGSYRSIFKYGAPGGFKHPSDQWVAVFKETFGLADDHFDTKTNEGNEKARLDVPCALSDRQVTALGDIVGEKNVNRDGYSRIRYSCGKTAEEMMELGQGIVHEVTDLVLHPRHKEDVSRIVAYCNHEKIPVVVYAGGSSVTLGLRPVKGGVTLAMSTHMNALLALNEEDQTARVQPGMFGPAYEEALNEAPQRFDTGWSYTGGHFPQSFEYSTVGGWVVTLGSGQASTYYGDAADLVISQEYVTPSGSFRTLDFPATATGPKINDMMKGTEGTFGILVEVTLRVFRHQPQNRRYFSFMFPSWKAATAAGREVLQGQFGRPAVFRLSDPEETDLGLKLFGVHPLAERFLALRGLKPMQRCVCMGSVEGQRDYTRLVHRKIKQTARRFGGLYLGAGITRKWEKTRYTEPYMREDLNDFGITIDTLETGVTWSNLHHLYQTVRAYIKERPATICMTHASHFYPQGTNLYFIFIGRFDTITDYRRFHAGILDRIQAGGGSLSHHHGVGRLMAPWMQAHLGEEQMAALRALKNHFDPNGIMNPGGLLGLDALQDRTAR